MSIFLSFYRDLRIAISGSSAGLISHLLPLIIVDLVPQCCMAGAAKVGTFIHLADDKLDFGD